ncbi:2'-5' RNA ligase family protein [Haloarchaeobius iranensis]|uniref:2'-5' RNA ligase n=1 Tax=Haloarchaeobius iranensis TaxID=996166 RepID=A0A1G9VL27_9EURY|nr:2'-5' RNA ligase family protein [Haloarchaeobius iranensis]SDM72879.1 2'-5' RNA ligase [Haloarchaeobius iranensis]
MFSLNVPVPGSVSRLAHELQPALFGFERVRDEHTLLAKRIGDPDHFDARTHEVRRALRGQPAFEVQVTGVDYFAQPTVGTAPVVYLAVESPGLRELHDSLVDEFGAIDGLEGEDYTPHVTLARDGDMASAERAAEYDVEPVTWTVTELEFFDAQYREVAGRISLPA